MQTIAEILRFPVATPRRAFFTVVGLFLWSRTIPLIVTLAHADWHQALASFAVHP